MARTLGGHARVGFENNLVLADGAPAPNNAHLVRRMAQETELIGRPVASAAWLREHLW